MAAALTIFKRFLRSNQNNVLLVNILTLILFLMVCVYFNDLVANFFNIGSIVRTTKIVVSALCSWILFTNFWMQSTFSFVLVSVNHICCISNNAIDSRVLFILLIKQKFILSQEAAESMTRCLIRLNCSWF